MLDEINIDSSEITEGLVTSTSTNEDDYDDADEFIANRSQSDQSLPRADRPQEEDAIHVPKIENPTVITTNTDDDVDSSIPKGSKEHTPEESHLTVTPPQSVQQLHTPEQAFEFESPMSHQPFQAPTSANSGSSSSGGNRRSIFSDYAPSIHEVHQLDQVAYVVDSNEVSEAQDGQFEGDAKESHPFISRKPSVVRITKRPAINIEGEEKGATGVVPNENKSNEIVSQERFKISTPSAFQSEPGHQKTKSLGSNLSSNTVTSSSSKNQSTSGKDLLQEDNESHAAHSSISQEKSASSTSSKLKTVRLTRNQSLKSTDSFSFDEGEQLITRHTNSTAGKIPDLAKEVSYEDLPIPSRSPNRPISGINFTDDPLSDNNKIELLKIGGHTKSTSLDMGSLKPTVAIDELIHSIDDEITSNQGGDDVDDNTKEGTISEEQEQEHSIAEAINEQIGPVPIHQRNASGQSVNPRPLPPPPVPQHTIIPSGSSRGVQEDVENDDGFVTEEEEEEEANKEKDTSREKAAPKRKSRHSKRKSLPSSNFNKGQFDHDTLVQLLQITNGTIIGQEFQSLGLQTAEKQLLERLVDSLSRLTADMIVDQDRHDESVKRLSKAIKALEGF